MAKNEQESVTASPVVPMGYRQLGTQVAGHKFEASNAAAVGLLQAAGEGRVFKPLGKPECGVRELNFYESLAKATSSSATAPSIAGNDPKAAGDKPETDDALLAALAAHVPRYYGHVKLMVNQREHTFIKLEDLTCGMTKPCVMDIKIGRRTWDPLSSPHKRAIEEQKYVICKQQLGLCLPGFQVYLPNGKLIREGRDFGKSLNVEGFRQALAMFLHVDGCSSFDILLKELLRQLRAIRSWFKRQRLLHFYASSLLICYDFERLQQLDAESSSTSTSNNPPLQLHNGYHPDAAAQPVLPTATTSSDPSQWVRVRCIDFAHIFAAEDAQPDHNYMFGLQSLIDIIESMLRR